MIQFIKRNNNVESTETKNILEKLLYERGIVSSLGKEEFLHPSLSKLHSPFLMRDMQIAVDCLHNAIANKDKIMVFGDYDCDGVCATTIITSAIEKCGGNVDFYVPSREEGYGLNKAAIFQIAQNYQVLITVDLGISNIEEIEYANSLGLKVIISDHHQLPDTLPNALAIVHPALKPYPFTGLCGGAVAFKIAQALLADQAFEFLDFAAIATIGDLMPLVDENRIIVHFGLLKIQKSNNEGIKALLQVAKLTEAQKLQAVHIAFRIAPRINAAGRVDSAYKALELFKCKMQEEALEKAIVLDAYNAMRKGMEKEVIDSALEQIEQLNFVNTKFIVVSGENWHHGVIGLAAGKICEKFNLPVAVFTVGETTATASLRSIPGINIYHFLKKCEDLFIKWGGHEQAAGLTLHKNSISEFAKRMNEYIVQEIHPDTFIPTKVYDFEIELDQVDLATIQELYALEPTGMSNPEAVFLAKECFIVDSKAVGQNQDHLKLRLSQNNTLRDGIFFGGANQFLSVGNVDCLFKMSANTFNGNTKPQLELIAIQKTLQAKLEEVDSIKNEFIEAGKIHFLAESIKKYQSFSKNENSVSKICLQNIYGTLLLSYNKDEVKKFLQNNHSMCDVFYQKASTTMNTNVLIINPIIEELPTQYRNIVVLDSVYCQEQIQYLQEIFPNAQVNICKNEDICIQDLFNEEEYRKIFISIIHRSYSYIEILNHLQMPMAKIFYALEVFKDLNFLQYQYKSLQIELNANVQKQKLESSKLVQVLCKK
ncbi:MAG: single-stranded-DNA-specific exonuclease RecJ [Eubacteriales bacterium]|nr:single-stranded-DNA-specific exonuclease RecJ [Eubacteriales bacterium]